MNYILYILVLINIYLILSLSLNILVGYTGLLSVCHAAFYGIGAYISTLTMFKLGLGFFPSLILAILGTMLLSLVVSIPSIRLRGDYFILATLGFQNIVFGILYNWVSLTRGPYGIKDIPKPNILGFEFNNIISYFILSSLFALLCIWVLWRLSSSPFGRALKAIREDEIAALGLGKNVVRFKIYTFMISSGIAAIAGVLYAGYFNYIDPTSFTVMESILILSIILVGGTGNIKGPIIGTIFLVTLPELLRFLNIPQGIAPNTRQMIYGLLLIVLMRYRTQGIAGEYRFE